MSIVTEETLAADTYHQVATQVTTSRAASAFWWSLVVTGLPLCLCDIAVILAISSGLAYTLVAPVWGIDSNTFLLLQIGLAATCPVMFYLYGLYPGIGLNSDNELCRLCKASMMLALIYFVGTTAQDFAPGTNTLVVVLSWPFWLVGLPLARRFVRCQLARYRWWGLRTIVLGNSLEGEAVYEIIRRAPDHGLRATGYFDELHSLSSISQMADEEGVHHAVVAISDARLQDVLRLLANGDHGFLQLTVIPSAEEPFDLGLHTIDVGSRTLGLVGQQRLLLPTNRLLKRLFDVAIVVIGGTLVLPCILGIMLMIKLSSRGPVFYGDLRIGRDEKKFYAWKFRTMVPNADQVLGDYLDAFPEMRDEWEHDKKLKDDPRITRLGRILRRASLDEIPQLWNVLRGDMSLVGPRPIFASEVTKYAEVFDLYKKVLPGITGLWQVSGRNDTTYSERITLVASYVRNWSLWLDLCILARTPLVVFRRDGAY